LIAAYRGEMLAKDARKKMRLFGIAILRTLEHKMKDQIEIRPFHPKKGQNGR